MQYIYTNDRTAVIKHERIWMTMKCRRIRTESCIMWLRSDSHIQHPPCVRVCVINFLSPIELSSICAYFHAEKKPFTSYYSVISIYYHWLSAYLQYLWITKVISTAVINLHFREKKMLNQSNIMPLPRPLFGHFDNEDKPIETTVGIDMQLTDYLR